MTLIRIGATQMVLMRGHIPAEESIHEYAGISNGELKGIIRSALREAAHSKQNIDTEIISGL